MIRTNAIAVTVMLLLCAVSLPVCAGPVVPAGLSPGDKYQLVFITDGTINAMSADIAVYNAFAQAQAELNPSLTGTDMGAQWKALVSTPTIDANANAVVGANTPVYLLNGTKIADGFADMWDQSVDALVNVNQYNAAATNKMVWTGSFATGTGAAMFQMGGSGQSAIRGSNAFSNTFWFYNNSENPQTLSPLYVLSGEFTVPVPEPGTMVTFATGFGLFALTLIRRRRSKD